MTIDYEKQLSEIDYGKRLSENVPKSAKKVIERADSLERVYEFCLVFFKLDLELVLNKKLTSRLEANKKTAIDELLKYCIKHEEYNPLGSLIESLLYTLTFFGNKFKEKSKLTDFGLKEKTDNFGEDIAKLKTQIETITSNILVSEGDDFEKAKMLYSFFLGLDESEAELNKVKKQALTELIQEAIKRKDLSKLNEVVNSVFGILDYMATRSLELCIPRQRETIKKIFNSDEANQVTDKKREIFRDIEAVAKKGKFKNRISLTWYSVLNIFATNPPLTKPKESEVVEKKKQVERPRAVVLEKIEDPPKIGKATIIQTFIKEGPETEVASRVEHTEQLEKSKPEELPIPIPEPTKTVKKQTEEDPEKNVELPKSEIVLEKISETLPETKIISFKDLPRESTEGSRKTKVPRQPAVTDEISPKILAMLEKFGILLDSIFISNKNTSKTVEKMDAFIALLEDNNSITNTEIATIKEQISDIDRRLNMVIDLLKREKNGKCTRPYKYRGGFRKILQPYKYIRAEDIPKGATLLKEGERHQKCRMPFTKWGWDRSKLKKQEEGKYRYTKVEELPEGATLLKEGERHGKCSRPQRKLGRKNGNMIKVQEVTIDLNNQSMAIVPQTT